MREETRKAAEELKKSLGSKYSVRMWNAIIWMPEAERNRIQDGASTPQVVNEIKCYLANHPLNRGDTLVKKTYRENVMGTDEIYVEFITKRRYT